MVRLTLFFMLIAGLFSNCTGPSGREDFYSNTRTSDLWRLPLYAPYELVSPTNTPDDWYLVLQKHQIIHPDFVAADEEFQFSNIDSAAVQRPFIFLHSRNIYWPRLSGSFPSMLILDATRKLVWLYPDQQKTLFRQQLKAINADKVSLLPLSALVQPFQEKNQLPPSWKPPEQ